MYKNIVLALLMQVCCVAAFSQTVRPPLGIPNLAISPVAAIPALGIPPLTIPGNQTITGITDCPCMSGCFALPVKLLSFEGRRENHQLVILNWKTTNEINNKGFEVERSLGDTRQFETVGFVPASITAAAIHKYEFPDNNNFSGTSYYRLKQLDIDNNFAYSDVVAVKGYDSQPAIMLFPNPVTNKLTADVFSDKNIHATLLVTDALQKQIFAQNIVLRKGSNLFPVPAAKMKTGMYVVRVITEEGQVLSEKFVKR